jgi:N-acetylmuramic acid 6-phosphate etherase
MPDRTPVLFAGGASALLHMTGGVEDDPALAAADFAAAGLRAGDAVLCLSASGGTPYTLEVARGGAWATLPVGGGGSAGVHGATVGLGIAYTWLRSERPASD